MFISYRIETFDDKLLSGEISTDPTVCEENGTLTLEYLACEAYSACAK